MFNVNDIISKYFLLPPALPVGSSWLTLLCVSPQRPLLALRLGHSSDLRPGEFVVAVGIPLSLQNTVTTGIVSSAQHSGLELGFQDAQNSWLCFMFDLTSCVWSKCCCVSVFLQYGNSGGPLVNLVRTQHAVT